MTKRSSARKAPIVATIVNLTTGKVIELNHIPDELEDSHSASFSEVNIQGRSAPVLGYDGSGPRTIRFSLQLNDDYCPAGIRQEVQNLKALTYPKYKGSSIIPPRCYVRIGNFIRLTGVCDDVSVSWKKPYRNGVFVNADVSLSFKSAQEMPLSANDVQWGEG